MSSHIPKESFRVTTSSSGVRSFGDHDDRSSPPSWRGGRSRPSRGGGGRGKRYNNYNDRNRRNRSRGARGGNRSGPYPRSRLEEDDDGDVAMDDGGGGSSRFTPYARPPTRRGHRAGGIGGEALSRLGLPLESGSQHRSRNKGRDQSQRDDYTWAKITISEGQKYEKDWLMQSLQNLCHVPFQPVDVHFTKGNVCFYVDDRKAGDAIKALTRRITTKDGDKVIVLMRPCPEPTIHVERMSKNALDASQLDMLKQVMSKRFDPSILALDLSNLVKDSDLQSQNIQANLSRENITTAIGTIISENIPQMVSLNLSENRLYNLNNFRELVLKAPNLQKLSLSKNGLKSEWDLDKIKGFKLTELVLDGNPLCDNYKDQRSYVRTVRQRFPKLVKLDGHELPPMIGFDLDSPNNKLPETKGSFFVNETLQTLILKFLEQYYAVYDSGNRQKLLDAYHEKACFSLTIPPPPPRDFSGPKGQSLGIYVEYSRSIRRTADHERMFKRLKQSKINVVAYLNELPETQHDSASFVIDVSMATNTLLNFSVSGLFKETNSESHQLPIRAFTRTFLAVPAGNGLCIINDQLCIMRPTANQRKGAFRTPAPTPSTSPVPPEVQQAPQVIQQVQQTTQVGQPQQQAVQSFSQQSGMNFEWSQKCLAENNWDYEGSARIFTDLHAKGTIPPEAFVK
ncbi:nuclear RNA export factor 1-like isoform X2 [Glandiceps talaboti]